MKIFLICLLSFSVFADLDFRSDDIQQELVKYFESAQDDISIDSFMTLSDPSLNQCVFYSTSKNDFFPFGILREDLIVEGGPLFPPVIRPKVYVTYMGNMLLNDPTISIIDMQINEKSIISEYAIEEISLMEKTAIEFRQSGSYIFFKTSNIIRLYGYCW